MVIAQKPISKTISLLSTEPVLTSITIVEIKPFKAKKRFAKLCAKAHKSQ
jgi:hypothetical protein